MRLSNLNFSNNRLLTYVPELLVNHREIAFVFLFEGRETDVGGLVTSFSRFVLLILLYKRALKVFAFTCYGGIGRIQPSLCI